jgi:hypothetical protein
MTDTIDPLALSAAAEQTADLLRQLRPDDVRCDAGTLTGDSGVFCSIEQDVVEARTSPSSVMAYCCGEPTECPTWRKTRDAEWGHGQSLDDLRDEATASRDAKRRRGDAKRERVERAAELIRSPTKEGEAFRARLFKIIREAEARTK